MVEFFFIRFFLTMSLRTGLMTIFFVSHASNGITTCHRNCVHCISYEQHNLCLIFKTEQKSILSLKEELLHMFCVLCTAFPQQSALGLSVYKDSYHTEKCNTGFSVSNGEVHTIYKIAVPCILRKALVWASLSEFVLHGKQKVPLPSTEWSPLHTECTLPEVFLVMISYCTGSDILP
jgi:hypothetical protein